MRALAASLIVTLLSTVSAPLLAQPGAGPGSQPPYAGPPGPPAPYPPPPQQPGPYPYPPQQPQPAYPGYGGGAPYYPGPGYGPPMTLSPEDQELLASGEITDGQTLGGVLAELFLGFGIGQAVEGRWGERGWIFTLGEVGSLALIIGAAIEWTNDVVAANGNTRADGSSFRTTRADTDANSGPATALVIGLIGYCVFRVWGVIDAAAGPSEHNNQVRELRARLGYRPMGTYGRMTPYVAPHRVDDRTAWTAGLSWKF